MKIRFSDDAKEDVQDIADYTLETWGEEQETAYLNSLHEKLAEIAADPERWGNREDLFADCQVASFGRHVIFFSAQDGLIFISRILHQSMDIPRHIFPTQEG